MTGWLQIGLLLVALVAVHRPLGEYMARVFDNPKHLRVERGLYRLMGVDPDADQRWPVYLRSVLAFSVVGVLFLYAFQRLQQHLLLSLGFPAVSPSQAFNTAVSFATNTNWQSYSGEATMGHLVQMSGLAVQNFVSAAAGIAVAVALIRGFARTRTDRLGNFWVDLTRASLRILLPLAVVAALVMIAGGVIQNLSGNLDVATLSGGAQSITGGPIASQEAIKEIGTNGGGFYNANSSHPFEGPTAWVSLFEIFLLLMIPFSLPRTFGRMVGDTRQGAAIVGVMALIASASIALVTWAEVVGAGTAPRLAGAAMEGKEVRFGIPLSSAFASATTLTSTGSVNSFHDSFTALGGGVLLLDMMLGEVAPGGVGSGLYGMLVLSVVAVFVAGLMVGRTPEYLRKKIGQREMTLASLYLLATPTVVLTGTAIAMSLPEQRASMLNSGPHGLAEVLYAFTSAGNNNGSAFAGISVNTTWYNAALGLAMVFGRFLPLAIVLALAGALARQDKVPVTKGTLPTHTPLFIGLLTGIVLILVGLTYFPMLALGPFAEGL